MKIDLICNDGSPLGVTPDLIWSRGVGGAELAMMTWGKVMAQRGHEITIYNNPKAPGDHEGVRYANLSKFDMRHPRDALVVFRSPNHRLEPRFSTAKRVIWWSCDQYTVGDFKAFSERVDVIVTISPFHRAYHEHYWKIPRGKMVVIDLGVDGIDYAQEVEKVPNRLIFCSIPDRGLTQLRAAWPLIRKDVPDASLVITGDLTLWGASSGNQIHRLEWSAEEGVNFRGAIPRRELIQEQLAAEIHAYPCIYEELFCLSVAECQVAGAFPVTSDVGALRTTNRYGVQISGDPRTPAFTKQIAERVVSLLTSERNYLENQIPRMRQAAAKRFDWNVVARQWEQLIETGKTS